MRSWRWSRSARSWQRPGERPRSARVRQWHGSWSRPTSRLRTVVWPVVAVLLFGLGAFDYGMGVFGLLGDPFAKADATTAGPLLLISELLSCAALLLWPRLGARHLSLVTGAVAALSLATTAVVHVVAVWEHGSDSYTPVGSVGGFAEPAALAGLLVLTAWRGSPRWAVLAVPMAMAAIVVRPLAARVDVGGVLLAFFFTLVVTAALAIGLTARLVAEDRRRRASAVRLEQRAEFARDLHDFVAHHVTGIVIQAQGARSIAARRPDLVSPALERIEYAGAEALKSMRSMVGMLRDTAAEGSTGADGTDGAHGTDGGDRGREAAAPLAPLAGMTEVRSLVEEFAPVGGARASLRTEGDFDDLPMEVVTTLHRVVMEALTNIRKHARDFTEVEVDLVRTGPRLTVTVTDDGHPRTGHHTLQALGGGYGLKGLSERVGLIGGRVEAGPVEGGGWRTEATLPVGGAAAPAGRVRVGNAA
ncbi:sensor histidine kinase [Streptomyces sp. NPDC002643]